MPPRCLWHFDCVFEDYLLRSKNLAEKATKTLGRVPLCVFFPRRCRAPLFFWQKRASIQLSLSLCLSLASLQLSSLRSACGDFGNLGEPVPVMAAESSALLCSCAALE